MTVATYCQQRKNSVDPQQWLDHYTANGWKVGRNPMRDWKAAVRTWERNGVSNANVSASGPSDPPRAKPATPVTYQIPPGLDSETGEQIWKAAKDSLSKTVNRHSYETWLKPLRAAGTRDAVLYLTLPTRAFSDVPRKYGAMIADLVGDGARVEFLIPQPP
jgi:hypothetical protein